MKWYEGSVSAGARPATFADVGQVRRRVPSWLPGRSPGERQPQMPPEKRDRDASASLRPPKLPSEFVDAVRLELDQGYAGRIRKSIPSEAGRVSERPPTATQMPGMPSTAGVPSMPAVPVVPSELELKRAVEPATPDPMLVSAFEQALGLLASERERLLVETAGQVAELAAMIARRVIGRELSLDPMLVRELVREGIEALGQHDRVVVRVGKAFQPARQALQEELRTDGGRFEVRLDPSLGDYGCLVETELGQVDESIESRLETLLQALRPDSNPPD